MKIHDFATHVYKIIIAKKGYDVILFDGQHWGKIITKESGACLIEVNRGLGVIKFQFLI